jgi:three-Cys-motif partner protein
MIRECMQGRLDEGPSRVVHRPRCNMTAVDISPPDDDGLPCRKAGPWVRDKLAILEAYFPQFVKACRKKAPAWYYVDGLAGSGVNCIEEEGGARVWGSAIVALETAPPFSKCLLMEYGGRNAAALVTRTQRFGDRAHAMRGDVNADLLPAMEAVIPKRAPILCVLDPEGIEELHWSTVAQLSRYKVGRYKTELLILLNLDGAHRLLPLWGTQEWAAAKLDAFFPLEWRGIWQDRLSGKLGSSEDVRRALMDLYQRGLEDILNYRTVLWRPIRRGGREGGLKYVLVFATDNEAGERIMEHCFATIYPREVQGFLPGLEPPSSLH